MEIFGGFMVMMSIISLFLAVVWLIMPFVVFAMKGKQDRTLEVLEGIEKRLTAIENALHASVSAVNAMPSELPASPTSDLPDAGSSSAASPEVSA